MTSSNQPARWLIAVAYTFLAALVLVTVYSFYLSVEKQEDEQLEKAYQENLKNIDLVDSEGVHEIPSDDVETLENDTNGIDAANLGDDLDTQIVLSTEDTEEGYGFENAGKMYVEEPDTVAQ